MYLIMQGFGKECPYNAAQATMAKVESAPSPSSSDSALARDADHHSCPDENGPGEEGRKP